MPVNINPRGSSHLDYCRRLDRIQENYRNDMNRTMHSSQESQRMSDNMKYYQDYRRASSERLEQLKFPLLGPISSLSDEEKKGLSGCLGGSIACLALGFFIPGIIIEDDLPLQITLLALAAIFLLSAAISFCCMAKFHAKAQETKAQEAKIKEAKAFKESMKSKKPLSPPIIAPASTEDEKTPLKVAIFASASCSCSFFIPAIFSSGIPPLQITLFVLSALLALGSVLSCFGLARASAKQTTINETTRLV